jgi:hypothetical protein
MVSGTNHRLAHRVRRGFVPFPPWQCEQVTGMHHPDRVVQVATGAMTGNRLCPSTTRFWRPLLLVLAAVLITGVVAPLKALTGRAAPSSALP